jgi:hypothetical protein
VESQAGHDMHVACDASEIPRDGRVVWIGGCCGTWDEGGEWTGRARGRSRLFDAFALEPDDSYTRVVWKCLRALDFAARMLLMAW